MSYFINDTILLDVRRRAARPAGRRAVWCLPARRPGRATIDQNRAISQRGHRPAHRGQPHSTCQRQPAPSPSTYINVAQRQNHLSHSSGSGHWRGVSHSHTHTDGPKCTTAARKLPAAASPTGFVSGGTYLFNAFTNESSANPSKESTNESTKIRTMITWYHHYNRVRSSIHITIEGLRERTEHRYIFFPPITQWCPDVLFTGGRGVSYFTVLQYC